MENNYRNFIYNVHHGDDELLRICEISDNHREFGSKVINGRLLTNNLSSNFIAHNINDLDIIAFDCKCFFLGNSRETMNEICRSCVYASTCSNIRYFKIKCYCHHIPFDVLTKNLTLNKCIKHLAINQSKMCGDVILCILQFILTNPSIRAFEINTFSTASPEQNNRIYAKLIKIINQNRILEHLSFKFSQNIPYEQMCAMCEALEKNTTIKYLSLVFNYEDFTPISKLLRHNSTLKILALSNFAEEINDNFIDVFRENQSLQLIIFRKQFSSSDHYNDFRQRIRNVLADNSTLVDMDIRTINYDPTLEIPINDSYGYVRNCYTDDLFQANRALLCNRNMRLTKITARDFVEAYTNLPSKEIIPEEVHEMLLAAAQHRKIRGNL